MVHHLSQEIIKVSKHCGNGNSRNCFPFEQVEVLPEPNDDCKNNRTSHEDIRA